METIGFERKLKIKEEEKDVRAKVKDGTNAEDGGFRYDSRM